jgi:hypothetical protein
MKRNPNPKGSLHKHSLRLAALAVVVLLIVLYRLGCLLSAEPFS